MKFNLYYLVLFSLLLTSAKISADNAEPIVATVGGIPIYKSEFEYAYNKNSESNNKEQLTPKQFLDFYIDYKLKVEEAKKRRYDQSQDFKNEYNKYVSDLQKPYIEDSIFNLNWIKQLYDRITSNIEIEDIFIPYNTSTKYILPKDTLQAYKEAIAIREKINKDGSNFEKIAEEYSTANENGKSVAITGKKRWISSLLTNLPYENAIYNAKVNEVTQPIRSQTGYSIVRVLNRRPDIGTVNLAAIQLKYPINASAADKDSVNAIADMIYNKLQKGYNFDSLYMQYSTNPDIQTLGSIGFWSVRRPLNKTTSEAIRTLKKGEYTKPFLLGNNINIVKVVDIKQIPPFDDFKQNIVARVKDVDYIDDFKVAENEAAKNSINYKTNDSIYNQLLKIASETSICDSLFEQKALNLNNEILLSINNDRYSVSDFMQDLAQRKSNICNTYTTSTDGLYYALNNYIYDHLITIKQKQLFDNYPILKTIADEYYNGLLYFDIMTDEVWDKAITDKQGIASFYDKNKAKYNWDDPRFEGHLIFTKNKELGLKIKQIIQDNPTNFVSVLKDSLNTNGELNVIIEKGLWSKGENQYIDELLYDVPASKTMIGYPIYFFEGVKIEQPRNLNDVRGIVTSDYQDIIEKEWLNKLRQETNITINNSVLDNISKKYNKH